MVRREDGACLLAPGPGWQALRTVSRRHLLSPHGIALAWLIGQPGIIAIPKAVTRQHIDVNRAAGDLVLTPDDRELLASAFPRAPGEMPVQYF